MPDLDTSEKIISIIVGVVTLAGLAVAAYRSWTHPLKIEPSKLIQLSAAGRDAIVAKLTNKSAKVLYITRCTARGTYRNRLVFGRFIRKPWMHPRWYPVIRFGAFSYDLLPSGTVKIEPAEPVELRHVLGDSWMSQFSEPYFLIEATLSTGRTVRSAKLPVPERWRRKLRRQDGEAPANHVLKS